MDTETNPKQARKPVGLKGKPANGAVKTPFANEDPETLRGYYRMMVLIRVFEERTAEMYTRAKIGGYCHLNLGEEATIVGLMAALRPEDYMMTNYREHGYILARGEDPNKVMAELFGKSTGVSQGRGGSMHLFDVNLHFLGGYGIVGGQLPLATGIGLALNYKDQPGVVVAQMGDATTNIGAFHESLNLARIWNLPCIFLVINNGYGMGTTVKRASAEVELYKKAVAYNIAGERVDGTDVLAVRDAVRRAVERGDKKEPTLLEAVSNRFKGHSVVDPDKYRNPEEVKTFRQQDPIINFARQLEEHGILTHEQEDQIQKEVEEVVRKAIEFADQSPNPEVSGLFDFMYATPVENAIDPQWEEFQNSSSKEAK